MLLSVVRFGVGSFGACRKSVQVSGSFLAICLAIGISMRVGVTSKSCMNHDINEEVVVSCLTVCDSLPHSCFVVFTDEILRSWWN